MRCKCQSTVEPVFGNLIHHYDLRHVGTRGKAGARKTMLLAAIAYNLKRLLKYPPRKGKVIALVLPPPPPPWPPFSAANTTNSIPQKSPQQLCSQQGEFCNSHSRFCELMSGGINV
ncbi:transposase [Hymenobacter psychrophilus]|uniref:transposase n=1 Tax=Hymenobacter psychrophilus TaxID=651662 RepID=UPI000B84C37F